jgi:hypothetical protein
MLLLALVPLAGCQFTPLPASSEPGEALSPSDEPTQNTGESGSDDLIDGDVFAERDAFFEAQQQIPGDPMLTPLLDSVTLNVIASAVFAATIA